MDPGEKIIIAGALPPEEVMETQEIALEEYFADSAVQIQTTTNSEGQEVQTVILTEIVDQAVPPRPTPLGDIKNYQLQENVLAGNQAEHIVEYVELPQTLEAEENTLDIEKPLKGSERHMKVQERQMLREKQREEEERLEEERLERLRQKRMERKKIRHANLRLLDVTPAQVDSPPVGQSHVCVVCYEKTPTKYNIMHKQGMAYICDDDCFETFRKNTTAYMNKTRPPKVPKSNAENISKVSMIPRKPCHVCKKPINSLHQLPLPDKTVDLCSASCVLHLADQKRVEVNYCSFCRSRIPASSAEHKLHFLGVNRRFCTKNCLLKYKASAQSVAAAASVAQPVLCDQCGKTEPPMYHLSMSDGDVRNFCSHTCVTKFQEPFGEQLKVPQPLGQYAQQDEEDDDEDDDIPTRKMGAPRSRPVKKKAAIATGRPRSSAASKQSKPKGVDADTQTEPGYRQVVVLPMPVPIYVPAPMAMYSAPTPYPLPVPVPVPFPVFIPTTKQTTEEVGKHIDKMLNTMPGDPFEAELLDMAGALADGAGGDAPPAAEPAPPVSVPVEQTDQPQKMEEQGSNGQLLETQGQQLDAQQQQLTLSEDADMDILLMAVQATGVSEEDMTEQRAVEVLEQRQALKRSQEEESNRQVALDSQKENKTDQLLDLGSSTAPATTSATATPDVSGDEDRVVKFSYGVNAWKAWARQKNSDLLQAARTEGKNVQMIKPDLLACTASELNVALCSFVKEVRKPNLEPYAPDSVFYLCLGIQAYLAERGRTESIFTDLFFSDFLTSLDEVLCTWEPRINAHGQLVCRIDEEQLWECRQLGAHSPYVLLNTLVYFTTRFYLLSSVQNHIELTFASIAKHSKRSSSNPSQRFNCLRYYPFANSQQPEDQQRFLEMPQNSENPSRCPIKLFDYYISKCPGRGRRTRKDAFYLVPERSCTMESPVWFSADPVDSNTIAQILHRIQLVKEIQEAFLAQY